MSHEVPPADLGFSAPRQSFTDLWERRDLPEPPPEPEASSVRTNLLLFLATVPSVFLAGARLLGLNDFRLVTLLKGWSFAVPFLVILLVHEFGHYIAARIHRVDASLPYFLPLPGLSPFGTLGAVIAMRGRIRSRDALLDIGSLRAARRSHRRHSSPDRGALVVDGETDQRRSLLSGGAEHPLSPSEAHRARPDPRRHGRESSPHGVCWMGRALHHDAEPLALGTARWRPRRLRASSVRGSTPSRGGSAAVSCSSSSTT